LADRLLERYEDYPGAPDEFEDWRAERDAILEEVYATTGAEPKY
jgi:hypothetical protein